MKDRLSLLTSHDTRDIELVCDRVIVINAGRIVVDQSTSELRRRFLGRKLVTIRSVAPVVALELPGVTRRSSEAAPDAVRGRHRRRCMWNG